MDARKFYHCHDNSPFCWLCSLHSFVSSKSKSHLGQELCCYCLNSWTHLCLHQQIAGNQAAEPKESVLESPMWLAETTSLLLRRGMCQLTLSTIGCEDREYLEVFNNSYSHIFHSWLLSLSVPQDEAIGPKGGSRGLTFTCPTLPLIGVVNRVFTY